MSSGIVAGVRGAIDAVAAVDLDDLSDDGLDVELVELVRERHRLDAQIARRAQRWEARSVWASDGSRSAAARLARDANVARSTAERVVYAGRAVVSMPVTAAAWAGGAISGDQVDLLRRAAGGGRDGLFARDEWLLVQQCATLRYAQASKAVRYWCQRADAELASDGTPPPPESYLRLGVSFQGSVSGEFVLDPVGGATVQAALARIEHGVRVADRRAGVVRSKAERMAAALVEMAVRAHACPPGAPRPEPLIMVLAGDASLERICELSTGVVIDPHLVVPHLARADIQTIVFDGAGRPVTGSRQRTFRGMLRRAIQVRDRHCQHPSGCDAPISECDVNHVVAHTDGGPTEERNGDLECWPHNRIAALHDARRRRDHEKAIDQAIRQRIDTLITLHQDRDDEAGRSPPPAA